MCIRDRIFPKYREQPILRPEWQLDLGYFAMNHRLIGVLIMVANGFDRSWIAVAWSDEASELDSLAGLATIRLSGGRGIGTPPPERPTMAGGCAVAGGGSSSLALVLLAACVARLRRRSRT